MSLKPWMSSIAPLEVAMVVVKHAFIHTNNMHFKYLIQYGKFLFAMLKVLYHG